MRLLGYCLIVLLIAYSTSFAAEKAAPAKTSTAALQHLSWLIGTWKSTMGDNAVYESWRADSTGRYKGMGFSVNGKDTAISERLLLAATDSGLYYISDVAHNSAPVHFKMTLQDSTTTVFENPKHDFPTRIIYRQVTADSLHAKIEGIRKGKEAGVDFVFGRMK